MKRTIVICTVLLLVAVIPMGHSKEDIPFLWLDATNNPGDAQNKWDNIGESGGDIGPGADLGGANPSLVNKEVMNGKIKAYYEGDAEGEFFGDDAGDGPPFHVEDYTFEMWLIHNGPATGGGEHQISGFYDFPEPARTQWLCYRFVPADTGAINTYISGGKTDNAQRFSFATGVDIGKNTWRQVVFQYDDNANTHTGYVDGKQVSKLDVEKKQDFDHDIDVSVATVFAIAFIEPNNRTMNGGVAILRVWDKLLDAQIIEDLFDDPYGEQVFSVDPADKISTTWGAVKRGF